VRRDGDGRKRGEIGVESGLASQPHKTESSKRVFRGIYAKFRTLHEIVKIPLQTSVIFLLHFIFLSQAIHGIKVSYYIQLDYD